MQEKEAEQKAIQDELQALNQQVEELVPQKDETQKARDQKKKALKTAQVSLGVRDQRGLQTRWSSRVQKYYDKRL